MSPQRSQGCRGTAALPQPYIALHTHTHMLHSLIHYAYTHTHTLPHTHMHAYYTHSYITLAHIHTYIHTRTHITLTHTLHLLTHTHTHTLCFLTYIHTHTHARTHITLTRMLAHTHTLALVWYEASLSHIAHVKGRENGDFAFYAVLAFFFASKLSCIYKMF